MNILHETKETLKKFKGRDSPLKEIFTLSNVCAGAAFVSLICAVAAVEGEGYLLAVVFGILFVCLIIISIREGGPLE